MGYAFSGRLDQTVFHKFFYDDSARRWMKAKSNTHYDGNRFFSYSTVIGQILNPPSGGRILLYSYWSMSNCTGRHISSLRGACPNDWEQIPFPFKFGGWMELTPQDIKRALTAEIEAIGEDSLSVEESRRDEGTWSWAYRRLAEAFGWDDDTHRALLEKLDRLDAVRASIDKKREAARERRKDMSPEAVAKREADREAKRRRMEKLAASFDGLPVLDLIAKVFGGSLTGKTGEMARAWLLEYSGRFAYGGKKQSFADFMTGGSRYNKRCARYYPYQWSLVWMKGPFSVRTTKGVTVDVETVKAAFRAFDALEDKKDFVGYELDRYHVAEVSEEEIVIGCHSIPMENINALRERLFPKEEK